MTVALIAGQGGLPPHLARVMLARGEVPIVCEAEQFPSDIKGELPRIGFRLETLGTFLATLKEMGVSRVCMAGAMSRPPVDPAKIDAATMPLVPKVQKALANAGDDGTLRIFVNLLEEAGLEIVGAADLDPGLLPPAGVTGHLPEGIAADLAVAREALAELGRADQGQAVVVRQGTVIAREDRRGTDAMLQSLVPQKKHASSGDDPFDMLGDVLDSVADWLSGPEAEAARDEAAPRGGFLYKAPKPGQELRVDMPLIGPSTALHAAAAGLEGIVIEAGGVMVLDPDGLRQAIEEHGLFLWVCPREDSA